MQDGDGAMNGSAEEPDETSLSWDDFSDMWREGEPVAAYNLGHLTGVAGRASAYGVRSSDVRLRASTAPTWGTCTAALGEVTHVEVTGAAVWPSPSSSGDATPARFTTPSAT